MAEPREHHLFDRSPITGRFYGIGAHSIFFRLRDYPRLGALISRHGNNHKEYERLVRELRRGKLLRHLGVPVPRYVTVRRVRISAYAAQALGRFSDHELERIAPGYRAQEIRGQVAALADTKHWALIMEHIEEDVSLVSPERIKRFVEKEARRMNGLGVYPSDFAALPHYKDWGHAGLNVLWSAKKKKLYFIDFENWNFSDELKQKLKE